MSSLLRNISSKVFNLAKNHNAGINNLVNVALRGRFYSNASTPYEIVEPKPKLSQEIINKVNTQIASGNQGRLFAIVHLAGKQFKITEGDVIAVEGYWPPDAGDKISLDKILLVGAADFTLVGRPLVERNLVNILATVSEKRLSHTKTHFRKKRRKQYQRINFYREQQTMVRINSINIVGELNNPPSVTGVDKTLY